MPVFKSECNQIFFSITSYGLGSLLMLAWNIINKKKQSIIFFSTMLCLTSLNNAQEVNSLESIANPLDQFDQTQPSADQPPTQATAVSAFDTSDQPRTINKIVVVGNTLVSDEAILSRVPYKVGEIFDPKKTSSLIRTLYYDLKRFNNIQIFADNVNEDKVDLYIQVEEKRILKEVIFKGNKAVSKDEVSKKIDFVDLPTINEHELKQYARMIKKIYAEKGYYLAEVNPVMTKDDDGKITVTFEIEEQKKSLIKEINFKGNKHISGKKLRSVIFSKEDWVLSLLDGSGTFHPERLEGDKHMIEQLYQSRGYFTAKVIDVEKKMDPETKNFTITFEVQEGDLYTVSEVKAPGNDELTEEQLLSQIPIRPGNLYSRKAIQDTMKILEMIWGSRGYLYTHIEPSIQPDENTKTVKLSFHSELGSKVFLNKLTVRGNSKTRDKIVRRQIMFEEGDLLTNNKMEQTKNKIEGLGYFDQREGVNWKITRLDQTTADLDLILKEVKTGNAGVQLGFGGSATDFSPASGFSVEANLADSNLFGSGVNVNMTAKMAKGAKTFLFNVTDPWLFDKPIYGSFDAYHKRVSYDELNHTRPVNEIHTGATLTSGFVLGLPRTRFDETYMRFGLGLDKTSYEERPLSRITRSPQGLNAQEAALANTEYQSLLDSFFHPTHFGSFSIQLGQDKKNHPMHPSRGHIWHLKSYTAFSGCDDGNVGFHKLNLDFHWFTPLIGERDLVFHWRSYAGIISRFNNRLVPYRELFHAGGQANVRGFLYGQIGPQFSANGRNDSIGARKLIFWNAELIFPITPDFSMKAVVFYDGGSGWDNPYSDQISEQFLKNNGFDYRHSVGIGIRLLKPMPMKVDWGVKLDTRKGEASHEVHFNMSYDW